MRSTSKIDQELPALGLWVFDADGRITRVAQKDLQQIYSRTGWLHDNAEILVRTFEVTEQAANRLRINIAEGIDSDWIAQPARDNHPLEKENLLGCRQR